MNETATTLKDMLPFIIPLIVVQLALIVISVVDLVRRDHVAGSSKLVWVLVIILINIIGPIVYLAFGRRETAVERYTD
jgi:uncharacterized membrane protein YhaH (DUF805 family)